MTNFPEVHPLKASPEISAIYADIRAVSGLQMVNLIWRHIATRPDVLAWAWAGVRPLIGSQEMIAARQRLIQAVDIPAMLPIPKIAWEAAGVSAMQIPAVRSMVADYVRGNCTNIIALTALRLRLEGDNQPAGVLSPAPLPATTTPLAPLPPIDTLEPCLAAGVRALAQRHEGAQGGIIPSLYLELVRWPHLIDYLPSWLNNLYSPAVLRAARDSAIQAAQTEALAMLPKLGSPPPDVEKIRPTLEHFTRLVIPDLIPVCIAVDRLLPN